MKNKRFSSACYAIKDLVFQMFAVIGLLVILMLIKDLGDVVYWSSIAILLVGLIIGMFRTSYNEYENNRYFMVVYAYNKDNKLALQNQMFEMKHPLFDEWIIRNYLADVREVPSESIIILNFKRISKQEFLLNKKNYGTEKCTGSTASDGPATV